VGPRATLGGSFPFRESDLPSSDAKITLIVAIISPPDMEASQFLRLQVLVEVNMKITLRWDVTPCSLNEYSFSRLASIGSLAHPFYQSIYPLKSAPFKGHIFFLPVSVLLAHTGPLRNLIPSTVSRSLFSPHSSYSSALKMEAAGYSEVFGTFYHTTRT
jgi:hypothetical protein